MPPVKATDCHECAFYDAATETCLLARPKFLHQLKLMYLIVGVQIAGVAVTVIALLATQPWKFITHD